MTIFVINWDYHLVETVWTSDVSNIADRAGLVKARTAEAQQKAKELCRDGRGEMLTEADPFASLDELDTTEAFTLTCERKFYFLQTLLLAASFILFPPLLLLAVGWAVRWIFLGFKGSRA